jgi:hypothetical protein
VREFNAQAAANVIAIMLDTKVCLVIGKDWMAYFF